MHAFGRINKRKMKYMILWTFIVSTLTCYSVLAQNEPLTYPGYDSIILSRWNCPSPLIVKGSIANDDAQICSEGCCLACPFANNFYQENKIERTYKAFAILGVISFFLMIILSIFFVVLPSQKQNPLTKRILLPLALSVMYFQGSEFFTLNQKSQCSNPITPANPSSSGYCTIQAIFTLGGAYVISCYSALLVMHLHLISVWRTEFITKKILYFHLLILGGSLAAIIVPFVTDNVQSMNICFVSLDAAPKYFYFLSFIYIAFVAHLTTLIYMVHITIKSNRRYSTVSTLSKRASIIEAQRKLVHLKDIFMMQWRALLGALLMLIIYILNWNFYVYELQPIDQSFLTTTWALKWLHCLKHQGDQNLCASKIVDDVPNYNYILVLLFFNRATGILIFTIFAAKKKVILEVYNLIRRKQPNSSHSNPTASYFSENRFSVRSVGRSSTESATLAETVPSDRESTASNKELNEVRNTSVKFSDLPTLKKSTSTPTSLRNSIISTPNTIRNSRSLTLSAARDSRNSLAPISSIFNDSTHNDSEIVIKVDDLYDNIKE